MSAERCGGSLGEPNYQVWPTSVENPGNHPVWSKWHNEMTRRYLLLNDSWLQSVECKGCDDCKGILVGRSQSNRSSVVDSASQADPKISRLDSKENVTPLFLAAELAEAVRRMGQQTPKGVAPDDDAWIEQCEKLESAARFVEASAEGLAEITDAYGHSGKQGQIATQTLTTYLRRK